MCVMAENETERPIGPSKSFMTVGPTLHYSHANVRRCWGLAVIVYLLTCFFWSKILTGVPIVLDIAGMTEPGTSSLGRFIISPLSIYEYPWQITVLGLLMGILAVCPVLISQLLSFRYSLIMILSVVFIVKLPLFGLFLLVSCIAAACRPFRFRSRFIAIALCMAPQLVYWGAFGSSQSSDPIRWGFSFAPWISAWLTSLSIAGIVIGIGHFTRYRPGLVWCVNAIFLGVAVLLFQTQISFAELDYQLYIAGNNPEEVREFYDHRMTDAIDETIKDTGTQSFLAGLFYPTEPILLREELKQEIQIQLGYDRWPNWFKMPPEFNYQAKRQWFLNQYELFISKRTTSKKRMPTALYYKAMLNEYTPDIRLIGQTEVLHFYSDYPHRENLPIWYKLYDEFPQSAEALEARWRIAMHLAGQGEFEKAIELSDVAVIMLEKQLEISNHSQIAQENLFTVFAEPVSTVMTTFKLKELQRKLRELITLISIENRNNEDSAKERLAKFVILNPYARDYREQLDGFLKEIGKDDPLRDNILLARVMLITDTQLRAQQLKSLSKQFAETDGGIQAHYELGLLNIGLWKDPQTNKEDKDTYLAEARTKLRSFIDLYPRSIFREHAQTMLDSLPASE